MSEEAKEIAGLPMGESGKGQVTVQVHLPPSRRKRAQLCQCENSSYVQGTEPEGKGALVSKGRGIPQGEGTLIPQGTRGPQVKMSPMFQGQGTGASGQGTRPA